MGGDPGDHVNLLVGRNDSSVMKDEQEYKYKALSKLYEMQEAEIKELKALLRDSINYATHTDISKRIRDAIKLKH